MRNTLKVLGRDLLRLLKTPAALIVVTFLIVLPSLYSWLNVAGFWDPYNNTGNLRVCIVNEDIAVHDEALGDLDVGALVIEQLAENDQLGWYPTSRDDALAQVNSGEAYAAFVIPSDFSSRVLALTKGTIERPDIEYYVNEKTGPVSPKITDTGANALDTTINDTFFSTVTGVVAQAVNDTLSETQQTIEEAQQNAVEKVGEAASSVGAGRTSLSGLDSAAAEATSKADEAKAALDDAKSRITTLSEGLDGASELVADASSDLLGFSASAATALDGASALASSSSSKANEAVSNVGTAVSSASQSASDAGARASALAGELRAIESQLIEARDAAEELFDVSFFDEWIDDLDAKASELESSAEAIDSLSSDVEAIAQSVSNVTGEVDSSNQQALSEVDAYRASVGEETIPEAAAGLGQISAASGQLSGTVAAQTALIDQSKALIDQLENTLTISSGAVTQTDAILAILESDLDSIKTDLAALSASDAVTSLLGDDGVDAEKVAEFMRSPTQVVTEQLYPLEAYGNAMAPLFINLTLWIGVFMLMVIFKLEVDDERIPGLTVTQRYFGRAILLGIICVLQAVVCVSGCLAMGMQTASAPLLYLTAIACSLTYLAIQYSLSTTLQHVGKALCIVLVFVQIPAATGLYPIEMEPDFFRFIHPAFPFTYGINAMRETISGFYGNYLAYNLSMLGVFFIVFTIIGSALRPFLTNLNLLFARQIEESGIVNGESVLIPERRYRFSQLVKAFSDREEYRHAITQRAESFLHLYPNLTVWGLFVGIAVPLILTPTMLLVGVSKVVILTGWLVWLVLVAGYFIVLEYMRDSINRQLTLEELSDEELREIYRNRKPEKRVRRAGEVDAL